MAAHADIFTNVVENAGRSQQEALILAHAVIFGNGLENGHRQALHLLDVMLVI